MEALDLVGKENRDAVAKFYSENESSICETVKKVTKLALALPSRLKLNTSAAVHGECSAQMDRAPGPWAEDADGKRVVPGGSVLRQKAPTPREDFAKGPWKRGATVT